MFEFLFKYPLAVFTKGEIVLLGSWSGWILLILIVASAGLLGWLIWSHLPKAVPDVRNWRAGVIWLLQSALVALLLILLWQPAVTVAELKPQQNIIAVVVDDSRSMGMQEGNMTREAEAMRALQSGELADLQKRYQVRLYKLDKGVARIGSLQELHADAPATRIGDGLKQLTTETSDLPIGAVLLLSDGDDNSGGIDRDTIAALRNRRIPVHTVGLGAEQVDNDVEMDDASVATHALTDAKLAARVTFHQRGFAGKKSTLSVRDGDRLLASQPVTFGHDGEAQTETLLFSAGSAGAKNLQFAMEPVAGEQNRANNGITRLLDVDSDKRRILYVEGEPRWEYKFIRRAEDDDRQVQLASMLRTTENKIYRQGVSGPDELADGFPSRAQDLFGYSAIIIGSVEAGYFTPAQQDLIRQFVDRRGGGLLFLGGRFGLSDGGWNATTVADVLPTILPSNKSTFHRVPATVSLTPAGTDSLITRLIDDPQKNVERWKKLPYLMDYQDPGTPKPGATVLAMMSPAGRPLPMLITQNYGRGRVAILATSGTWRWQMSQPLGDTTHDTFWRQLLRWEVGDTPGNVVASVPNQILQDDGHIQISAEVRDKEFQPAPDARVQAHIIGSGNVSAAIDMTPVPDSPGNFQADWNAPKAGSYLAEVTAQRGTDELGRSVLTFQRMDGVAENFHTGQNSDLLQKLSEETGGRYWKPQDISKLDGEIPLSEAGITVRDTKELWNMPVIFLLILLLRCSEWFLRRKWGVV